jgi:cobalt/nickel transport protein
MKRLSVLCIMGFILCIWSGAAIAHFGMIIPSDSMVMQSDLRTITVTMSFSHPFEGEGMELVRPAAFGVMVNGKKVDLFRSLKATKVMGHNAWEIPYEIKRPGVYMFYMEPQPYWEPAEDCYIVHYTKTVVTAFGDDEGWDGEIGLKTEIVPLSKPYGLYTGNVFQGIVKLDGKPVPFCEVEVEYYNKDGKAHAPTDYMVTQTIKADANGVFTYSAPAAGWWGFAALNTSEEKIRGKDVEMGAVLWVKFHEWK